MTQNIDKLDLKNSFYFVRHGDADYPQNPNPHDEYDVSLTNLGRRQAQYIQPIIEKLSIKTICVSPLRRAIETNSIIAKNLSTQIIIIEELRECPGAVWQNMIELDQNPNIMCNKVKQFMERVIHGINMALSYPGPVLIVAHGGIHWAMAHYLKVNNHDKKIGNCIPVHFYLSNEFEWEAKHLAHPLAEYFKCIDIVE